MKKMNVLHIVGGMNRGGAETFLMNVLRNIDKDKFNFIFLCYGDEPFDYEDEIIALGGNIIRTADVKDVGPFRHTKNIAKILEDAQVDIIHAHTCYNSIFSIIAGKMSGVKVRITHSHNTKSEMSPTTFKRLYFMVSRVIINRYSTTYLACGQDAGKALFYKKNKFTVVDNGIILNDFYYSPPTRDRLREDLNIPQDRTVIMHVGRFDEQKNHNFLIDVYKEYLNLNPNSQLLLIGDGVLREDIKKKISDLKLQRNVSLLGKRADVNQLYNVADLFLFPSLHEGLPVTLVEAQANGLICLISNTIDQATKLTNCVHFLPLSSSAKQWAKKIEVLDLTRVDTRGTLRNGPYDITKNVQTIENLYERLLS